MIDKLEFLLALARETAFRPRRRGLRRDPADALGRRQAARGQLGVLLVQPRLALPGLHARGRAGARLGAPHRRRHPRHARRRSTRCKHGLTGHLRIAAIPTALAMVAELTTPYRARHPERAVHHPVAHLDRDAGRCSTISRSTPASPISTTSRSAACSTVPLYQRAVPAAHLGRRAARQSRQRDLGGGRRRCRSAC